MTEAVKTHQYIMSNLGKTKKWGERDCYTLVMGYIDYIKGTNFSHWVRGKYDSKRSALRFLANSYFTLEDYLLEIACLRYVSDLRMGDIIVFEGGIIPDSAIYIGDGKVFTANSRTQTLTMSKLVKTSKYKSFRL